MKYPMKVHFLRSIFICGLMLCTESVRAQPGEFSFGVISPAFSAASDDSLLRMAITETDADNLAFVVANGIKSNTEPCSDKIYASRKALLDEAKNGLVLSLTANDWIDCKRENGKSAAMERLNRLRDLFFADDFSFGASKIAVARQSNTPKFRSYGENARWQLGNIVFATINLPANNNHYRPEAGRNSEFEDRLIANRDWLQRIFVFATRKKLDGIVLFCDGNPLFEPPSLARLNGKRDGFTEIRRQIVTLTAKFSGKVLIVHAQPTPKSPPFNGIAWRDNLGDLNIGSGWTKITVASSLPSLFTIKSNAPATKITHQ